ncbi:MAG: LppX_LprAFG lipoprotein [Streptosporangiaceae bacterium]|jgi:hypothetical protein
MNPFATQPRPGNASPDHRKPSWLTASAGLCAAVVTLIAGCGSAHTSGSASGTAKPASPRQAITMAAETSQRISSVSETLVIKVAGPATETTTGSLQMQLKPSLLSSAALNIGVPGNTIPVAEVLGSEALYLKVPGVSQLTGRPWLKISFAQLSGKLGASFGQLLQSMQNSNPLGQTQIFAASKNVHATGNQVVSGVQTTRYTGSFSARAALAALSPSLRKLMGPALNRVTGDAVFTVWIDGQHHVRRIVEVEQVNGASVDTTMNVTAINQPVHISPPPASQVAAFPQRLLNTSGGGVL